MLKTVIMRRVDSLGSIALPKELRDSVGLDAADSVEIFTMDKSVVFRK